MENLKTEVIKQLGYNFDDSPINNDELRDTLRDIANFGIDGGFNGFIYYSDTVPFAERNKTDILNLARDMADDIGCEGVYSFIAGFNCLDMTTDEVADAIHDDEHDDYISVMNALAWFAAEEVARAYEWDLEA